MEEKKERGEIVYFLHSVVFNWFKMPLGCVK